MMMEFNIEILRETYQEMQQLHYEMQQNMKRIEFLIENLQGEWKGEVENAFEQRLNETKSQCRRLNEFLGEYAQSLEAQVKQYENQEQELYSKLLLV